MMPAMPLQALLRPRAAPDPLLDQLRKSPSAQVILNDLRAAVPELSGPAPALPQTTYTLYRQFARSGERVGYEERFFAKRSMLTRAVVEILMGEGGMIDAVHDLLWSICEETSWVLPAHEDRGPGESSPSLIREPDYIDLFAAETGASLAETLHLLGEHLSPEVAQRVGQEVERRIFRPYLAYGRKFWWHTGDLNWNAVCNGAVGLAFMRLETDPGRLAEALGMVLEGFDAYLATGFEPDGGSLEGISYWNYGLLYFVAASELLRQQTAGQVDLMMDPRLINIARFPLSMALAPGLYLNFGDADERAELQPGVVQRLAERTGLTGLCGLIAPREQPERHGRATAGLPIVLRDMAWWDAQPHPFPAAARQDFYLPDCAVVRFNARTPHGQPVILAAKAGRNDGHHYHTDIGHFVVNVGGESLLCDPGRGLYTREYFRQQRFENIFCNSFGHSVPRIAGRLQMAGPKFGGGRLAEGTILDHGQAGGEKFVTIDFSSLYGLPQLGTGRRKLQLIVETGEIRLEDTFEFSGAPLEIEEAFVSWSAVSATGDAATITGRHAELILRIVEPAGASFSVLSLEEECRANRREGTLTRLAVSLPSGVRRFVLQITPVPRPNAPAPAPDVLAR